MASRQTHANALAREYLERFPKAPSQTLAKLLYKEHSAFWPTLNACKLLVRRIRGQQGRDNRKEILDRSLFDENGNERRGFPELPRPIPVDTKEWKPFEIDTPGQWMILSDAHVPYHDEAVIEAAFREARRRKVAGILLNGDIMDCHAISRWETSPDERDFPYELTCAKEFLRACRYYFRKARIVFKYGNHELRYISYMTTKAPEFLGVDDFQLDRLLECSDHGIEVVTDNEPIRLGRLYGLHGHEYKFPIQNPVNPARGLYTRAHVSAFCGHMHQSSSHQERGLDDHIVTCWSVGCTCQIKPRYARLNKWVHGIAFAEIASNGAYSFENLRYIDGRFWH